jgi:hypothetical protein
MVGVLAGCGGARDPGTVYHDLEQEMLISSGLELEYDITATGVFQASLHGMLALGRENQVRLEGVGTFGSDSVDLLLVSDGSHMRMTVGSAVQDLATPAGLHEAIVIGFTRMGLLHNLARLTGSAPPDHMEGGVQDWVQVSEFAWDTEVGGERDAVTFLLTVAGEPSGDVVLEVDRESGAPVVRRQVVRFPEGEMLVTETYRDTNLGAVPSTQQFALPAH